MTGGGLSATGQWQSTKTRYLLPVKLVKALYRGKLLALLHEGLNSGLLKPVAGQTVASLHRLLGQLRRTEWHVRLKERYAHGQGVMKYLARYVKGGPITDSRLVRVDDKTVTFRYRDHRDGRRKPMTLSSGDFMGRVLWHLPEPYQHTVRTAGLYSNRAGEKRDTCRAQLQQGRAAVSTRLSWQHYLTQAGHGRRARCPLCGAQLAALPRRRHNQNSYQERKAVSVFVQQTVETIIACVPRPP